LAGAGAGAAIVGLAAAVVVSPSTISYPSLLLAYLVEDQATRVQEATLAVSDMNSNDSDGSTSVTSRSQKKMRISYNKPEAKVRSLNHSSHTDSAKQHTS
jgi:hypothetical protein